MEERSSPPLKGGDGVDNIDLGTFYVIPAKAGIQRFQAFETDWTPVFTGVTTRSPMFSWLARPVSLTGLGRVSEYCVSSEVVSEN